MSKKLSKTAAIALSEKVCEGCMHYNKNSVISRICHKKEPCPYFRAENFYYDSETKDFTCCNYVSRNQEPNFDQLY
ncbi:MAG: hypothetical protein R3D71_10095 [Rickettsiales bacterium]